MTVLKIQIFLKGTSTESADSRFVDDRKISIDLLYPRYRTGPEYQLSTIPCKQLLVCQDELPAPENYPYD